MLGLGESSVKAYNKPIMISMMQVEAMNRN
jgi:hypothetical protein